jgi:hypothetical protein
MRTNLWAVLTLVCLALPAEACSVPVFRYALDRWPADPYVVTVFHRGPLSASQEALLTRLRNPAPANLVVRTVDVEKANKKPAKTPGRDLPYLVAEYPEARGVNEPAWSAPFDEASVQALIDSPVRQEIAGRTLKGQSAVWVLLECGHADKDEHAAKLLTEELARMPKALKLPLPDDAVAEEILSDTSRPASRIEFSLVRLPRDRPAEQVLVSMLLRTEEDLKTFDEPLAFAVFGRGRAAEALVGKGITAENIEKTCAFLIGACSCEVKNGNPGCDLLMAVDWDKAIGTSRAPAAKETRVKGKAARRKVTPDDRAPARAEAAGDAVPSNASATDEDLAPIEPPTSALRIALYVLGLLAVGTLVVALRVFR